MTTIAFKKVQYGYHGKNGVFSDHTERTNSKTCSRITTLIRPFYVIFVESRVICMLLKTSTDIVHHSVLNVKSTVKFINLYQIVVESNQIFRRANGIYVVEISTTQKSHIGQKMTFNFCSPPYL